MRYHFTVHADDCAASNILQVAGTMEVTSYGSGIFSFKRDLSRDDQDQMILALREIGSVTRVDVHQTTHQPEE